MGKDKIKWRNSNARGIILGDLEPGGDLFELDHLAAEEIWPLYKERPEFSDVPFSQFKERIRDHRKQAARDSEMARRDAKATVQDRLLFPRKTRNQKGELVFDLHTAKSLLRDDVKNGLHKHLSPTAFQQLRQEYMEFDLRTFKERIYQEVRRTKFLHYLSSKQGKQQRQHKAQQPNANQKINLKPLSSTKRKRNKG